MNDYINYLENLIPEKDSLKIVKKEAEKYFNIELQLYYITFCPFYIIQEIYEKFYLILIKNEYIKNNILTLNPIFIYLFYLNLKLQPARQITIYISTTI